MIFKMKNNNRHLTLNKQLLIMHKHELAACIFPPQLLHVGIIFIAIPFPVNHGCKDPHFTII